jgi:hypothetical protein
MWVPNTDSYTELMLRRSYRRIQNSSASGHIPGNLPPCGGSTSETGFADFSKSGFFLILTMLCAQFRFRRHVLRQNWGYFFSWGPLLHGVSQSGILTHCGLSYIVLNNRAWLLYFHVSFSVFSSCVYCLCICELCSLYELVRSCNFISRITIISVLFSGRHVSSVELVPVFGATNLWSLAV